MTRPGDVRRTLVVRGRVQGVGYRAACARRAHELGVHGSVVNVPDGSVHVIMEGPPAAVEELTAWCRLGPPHASVTEVTVADGPAEGERSFVAR